MLSGAVLDAAQDLLARHFAQLVDRLSHQTYRRGFEERRVKIRKANQLNIPADLHTAFAKTVINIGAHQAIGGNDRSTPLLEQLPGAVPCAALHRISVLDKAILNRNGEIGHSLTVRRKALPRGAQAAQACNEADPPLPLFDQRGNAPVDGLIRGHRHGGKRRSVYLPVGQNSGEGRRKHRRKLAVGLHGRCQQDPVHNSGGKIPQML